MVLDTAGLIHTTRNGGIDDFISFGAFRDYRANGLLQHVL